MEKLHSKKEILIFTCTSIYETAKNKNIFITEGYLPYNFHATYSYNIVKDQSGVFIPWAIWVEVSIATCIITEIIPCASLQSPSGPCIVILSFLFVICILLYMSFGQCFLFNFFNSHTITDVFTGQDCETCCIPDKYPECWKQCYLSTSGICNKHVRSSVF